VYVTFSFVAMVCKGRGGGGEGSRKTSNLKLTLTIFFENIREFHKIF
jgi:hypothetical protein